MECLPIPGTSSPSARHTRLLPVCRGLELIDGKRLDTHAVCVMDLNLVAACGKPQACLGILDHGSRLCVRLTTLVNKRSWTLLGHLRLAIGQHGKPRAVRTDNEAIFNSFVFTTFLKLVGIRKQSTPVCAPWCNGRIERFFGTIKPWLRQRIHANVAEVQNALMEAAWFYNHVRPHQNLKGLTPKEAWAGLGWYQKISIGAHGTRCLCKPWMACFAVIGSGVKAYKPLHRTVRWFVRSARDQRACWGGIEQEIARKEKKSHVRMP